MLSRMKRLVPSPIRRFVLHTGRRGLFLLFFAFLWMSTGLRWIELPPSPKNYQLLFDLVPPYIWGVNFIITAFIMGAGAFWKRIESLSYAISAWLAIFLGNAVAVTAFSLHGEDAKAAWTIVFTYLAYALLVWVVSGWPEASSLKDPTYGRPPHDRP